MTASEALSQSTQRSNILAARAKKSPGLIAALHLTHPASPNRPSFHGSHRHPSVSFVLPPDSASDSTYIPAHLECERKPYSDAPSDTRRYFDKNMRNHAESAMRQADENARSYEESRSRRSMISQYEGRYSLVISVLDSSIMPLAVFFPR